MPLIVQDQPLPDNADGISVGRDGLRDLATVVPGAARAPEGERNLDEDEGLECVPSDPPEDDDDAGAGDIVPNLDFGSGRLTFPVAFDLLGRNPNHVDALETIRLGVIRWARRDGLGDEADDIAGELMLKLAFPGELAKARGRATFKGFVYGYYLNERRSAIRDRIARRLLVDIAAIERKHRGDATSETEDGAPLERDGNRLSDTESGDVEFDHVGGLSTELAKAMEALTRRYPRAPIVVCLRCEGAGYDEIAAELGISEANARQIYARAIRFLREYLGGTAR